jgi:hypothetical protein
MIRMPKECPDMDKKEALIRMATHFRRHSPQCSELVVSEL